MLFSVITPCFNSSKLLERAYQSLLLQSYRDFEWILIDDCSPDGGETIKKINDVREKSPFVVKSVFHQNNTLGSKCVASGLTLAAGDFVIVLDHDDELLPNALETFAKLIRERFDQKSIAGVCGRCCDEHGEFIGTRFAHDPIVANEMEVRHRMRVKGEMLQATKTELARTYFPMMRPGHTNGYVWSKIALKHDFVYTNAIVRIYHREYAGSYSNHSALSYLYPDTRAEAAADYLLENRKFFWFDPVFFLKILWWFNLMAVASGFSYIEIKRRLGWWYFILSHIVIFPALYRYLRVRKVFLGRDDCRK